MIESIFILLFYWSIGAACILCVYYALCFLFDIPIHVKAVLSSATTVCLLCIPVVPFVFPPAGLEPLLSSSPPENVLHAVMLMWMAGALVSASRLFRSVLILHSLLRGSSIIKNVTLSAQVKQLSKTFMLQNNLQIRESSSIHSLMLVGLMRPVLLIPSHLLNDENPTELQSVLYHELAHLSRNDLFFHYCNQALSVFIWFLPPCHWFKHEAFLIQDRACDEYAATIMGGRRTYAKSLLEIAKHLKLDDRSVQPIQLVSRGTFTDRILNLLHADEIDFHRVSYPLYCAILSMCIMLLYLVSLIGHSLDHGYMFSRHNLVLRAFYPNEFEMNPVPYTLESVSQTETMSGVPAFSLRFSHPIRTFTQGSVQMIGTRSGEIPVSLRQTSSNELLVTPKRSIHRGESINLAVNPSVLFMTGDTFSSTQIKRLLVHSATPSKEYFVRFTQSRLPMETRVILHQDLAELSSIHTADFVANGHLDLLVTCVGANNFILVNNGNGEFSSVVELLGTEALETGAAFHDTNRDGRIEIFWPEPESGIIYGLNPSPTGEYEQHRIIDKPGVHTLAFGDLNHDGWPDMVTGNQTELQQSIFFNDGAGTFRKASFTLGSFYQVTSIEIIDYDNDYDLDIVLGTGIHEWENNYCFLNDGTGSFPERVQDFLLGQFRMMDAADINNDGLTDLVIDVRFPGEENENETEGVWVQYNSADENRKTVHEFMSGGDSFFEDLNCLDFELVDLNADRFLDILVTAQGRANFAYINNSVFSFQQYPTYIEWGDEQHTDIALSAADFDSDGRFEIVTLTDMGSIMLHSIQE